MHLSTVSAWLAWIDKVHSLEIDLGLERVKAVAERIKVLIPACPVITVAGTNGKGSTVAGLEAIYLAANYRTGTFTSPYLFKPNEQVKINGQMVSDKALCEAFAAVEEARGDIPLTPFEFFTLAGLYLFNAQPLDVLILEVGLGGRLDAVNIVDASISVIPSIGIDHVNWLGHTREKIGYEKAGIFRAEKPVVCGDFDPPVTLTEAAANISAPFYQQGREFDFQESASGWHWTGNGTSYDNLPLTPLAVQNMSTVLMVITLLQTVLPVTQTAILSGLKAVKLPGRIQVVKGPITEIYDVAHNPAAIAFLKNKLATLDSQGKTYAVFSMLADKDIVSSLLSIKDSMDDWFVAPLTVKRAASEDELKKSFESVQIHNVNFYASIVGAYEAAKQRAKPGDRIVIFGSFHTVADVYVVRS